eukprot:comp23802_c0_seq2/m.41389 comp23802_c0_seq2/g.41389  ORF comp23802_c0_seq2/g.41389 comp23802_c0_seq2/m.41389 type:complete len:783 (-) comp23802_c0_seq2:206-2554(-)
MTICQEAFINIMGMCRNTFMARKNEFLQGARFYVHGNTGEGNISLAVERFIAWFSEFIDLIGQLMPDTSTIRLPPAYTKEEIWMEYVRDITAEDTANQEEFEARWAQLHPDFDEQEHVLGPDQTASGHKRKRQARVTDKGYLDQEGFHAAWRTHFKGVSLSTETTNFVKCEYCCILKARLKLATTNAARIHIRELREAHINLQRKERESYYQHRSAAIREPHKYMSVIVDSMDQAKSEIPNVHWNSKAASSIPKKAVRITSVLVHGRTLYTIVDEHGRKGANVQIAALTLAIERELEIRGSLPETLYVQMDNASENHCNAMMQFFELLVSRGVFTTVECSFLLPGHTHEDIDGRFRGFNHYLTEQPPRTVPDLMETLKKRPRSKDLAPYIRQRGRVVEPPEVHNVQAIPEFTEWLAPCADPLSYFAKWRCFRWIKLDTGVKFEVRRLASQGEWIECRGSRKALLHTLPNQPASMSIKVNQGSSIQPFPIWLREQWGTLGSMLERLAKDNVFLDPDGEHLEWWKEQAQSAGYDTVTGEFTQPAPAFENVITFPFRLVSDLTSNRSYPRPPPPGLPAIPDELEDPNNRDGDDCDIPCIGADGRRERRQIVKFTNPGAPNENDFVLVHTWDDAQNTPGSDYLGEFCVAKVIHIENPEALPADRTFWVHWWCPDGVASDLRYDAKLQPMFIHKEDPARQTSTTFPVLTCTDKSFQGFYRPNVQKEQLKEYVQWIDPVKFENMCGTISTGSSFLGKSGKGNRFNVVKSQLMALLELSKSEVKRGLEK